MNKKLIVKVYFSKKEVVPPNLSETRLPHLLKAIFEIGVSIKTFKIRIKHLINRII
jgi:hypothetical protein